MSNIVRLIQGDCIDKLKEIKDNSVDSVVTDPPYEIGFMGKGWDDSGIANNPQLWKEVLRVLKPGGHLLSFSHSRTYHRQAVAVEDAGFEIRDQIMWIYGSGFPKSHNIGKGVDKLLGNEREVVGTKNDFSLDGVKRNPTKHTPLQETLNADHTYGYKQGWDTPVTKGNSQYEGWGTALKPAHEPIVMARKPLSEKTIVKNVLEHGTGGINIDGCRVGTELMTQTHRIDFSKGTKKGSKSFYEDSWHNGEYIETQPQQGRFPANIIFDEEGGKILDEQSGTTKSSKRGAHNNKKTEHTNTYTPPQAMYSGDNTYGDTGGASRFFYCPKASKKDRNDGCDELDDKELENHNKGMQNRIENGVITNTRTDTPRKNNHPTVKPTDLMAYLVRLVTPKGGTVLDPFMGSGSTGKASVREGFNFIGIEREDEYMEIAKTRIEHEQSKNKHREFFDAV